MSERKQDKHASTAGQPRGLGSKNPKQGEEMIGAQAVVASLEAEGVDLVFGYPGGQAIKIYDALYDSKQLHHVLSRHEQGAVHEADGYARATGNVGVVIVTSGPGATNTVTGIATAYMDSVPLVVITGQVPRGVIGTDSFQESDIVGITMPVVKHSFLLQSTDELTSTFREAFHIAASGRPGPVLIDIPSDILSEKMVFNYPDKVNLPSYRPTYRGNAKQIRAAVQRIQRAERLIHQQHLRRRCVGSGNRHALLHAAGKLFGIRLGELRQANQVDVFLRNFGPFRFRHTLHAHAEFDVFLHRQPRIERILLKHNTFTLAWPCYQLAAHLDRARCRFTETGNDVEQCCFAAAGRADHADELVLLHIQVDGIQREEFAVFLFKLLRHARNFDFIVV